MRHRRQINETGPVESRFSVSQVKTLLFLGCIGWGHEAKNAFFRDDIETKSVDRSPRHSNRKNETFVQKDDRFERNLKNLYVLERIEKWLKDRRKYFTKIDRTFVNRTNKFSSDLSLETGYRRSPLNIKATRDISRDIFLLYGKKKKIEGHLLPPNSIIASFHVLRLQLERFTCMDRTGEDRIARRESSLGWLALESWKKSQLKEWFTRVDAARIRVMVRLVTQFQQLTVELFRCSWVGE